MNRMDLRIPKLRKDKNMKPRLIPIAVQLQAMQLKIDANLAADEDKPLWRVLIDGLRPKRSHGGDATVQYTSEILAFPTNAREAAQRRYHLAEWLKDGRSYEEFIHSFGPER